MELVLSKWTQQNRISHHRKFLLKNVDLGSSKS